MSDSNDGGAGADRSLRDWFAGQAIAGAADASCDQLGLESEAQAVAHAQRHATAAYMLADAMLKAREPS